MKKIFTLLALTVSLLAPMIVMAGDESKLDEGSPEMEASIYKDMTPAGIQKLIRQEISQSCDSTGLCKLFGVDTKTDTHWELTFSAGSGNQTSGQNNYYIGGTQIGNNNNGYVGATLTIKGPVTCRTTVMVDPSVFRLIKSYMYNNVKDDGKVARDFTEAEKTVMMFYGKIIEKAATCQTGR